VSAISTDWGASWARFSDGPRYSHAAASSFDIRGIPERRIVADDFKWLRALIREWSPGWNFSEEDFRPLKAAFSDPVRLAAALAYYRAIPRADLRLFDHGRQKSDAEKMVAELEDPYIRQLTLDRQSLAHMENSSWRRLHHDA
jgi:hypothetical protein